MQLSRRKLFGGFTMIAAVMGLAASSHAQAPAPSLSPATRLAPTNVQLQPVTVSPDLKAALSRKAAYDPKLLNSRITYQNNIPLLQLKNSRRYQLEPIAGQPRPPASLQMTALPSALLPYKPHVESPYIINKRVIKLADATVSNMAWQTPVKDQGARGTCTAFAAMGGLEARGKREGSTRDLSENHAFQLFMIESGKTCTVGGGFTTWQTGPILTERGVCPEALMPYTPSSCPATIPSACNMTGFARFTSTAHFFTPEWGGTGFLRADNTNLLESFIKAGHDIVYGLNVAGNDWSDGSGIIDVQVDSNGNPAPSAGGHAMLLVGYNRAANYFLVKNSWGTDWGHDGYAWISYEYLQTYGKYGYAVLNATVP